LIVLPAETAAIFFRCPELLPGNNSGHFLYPFRNIFLNERTLTYLCASMRARDENKERMIRQKAIEMVVKQGTGRFWREQTG